MRRTNINNVKFNQIFTVIPELAPNFLILNSTMWFLLYFWIACEKRTSFINIFDFIDCLKHALKLDVFSRKRVRMRIAIFYF